MGKSTQLAHVIKQFNIPVVILNACQSAKETGATETSLASRLMEAGIQMVLAMGYSVTVSAAKKMIPLLYEELFAHQDLSRAICRARNELRNDKDRRAFYDRTIRLEDWMLPVVYTNGKLDFALREMTRKEKRNHYQDRTDRYIPVTQPQYGFFGRDLDIMAIERRFSQTIQGNDSRLDQNPNILLIQGMGGVGKTSLCNGMPTHCVLVAGRSTGRSSRR